ncbi:hypothetical protein Tco_1385737 [Tanacetum coccineum]
MPSFIHSPQQTTPTPTPTTEATTFAPALPDFSSLFQFNNRVSALETEISQLKQADQSTQLLKTVKSQVSALVNDRLDIRLGDTKDKFMEVVSNSMMAKISEQVKIQLPIILPKEKILLEKMQKSQSYLAAPVHKELYDGLVKSYAFDKDFFSSYGKLYSETVRTRIKMKTLSLDQTEGSNLGNTYEKPKDTAAPSHDWFTKPKGPPTSTDLEWNKSKTLKEGPAQSWISTIAHAEEPSTTFNQLMSTPINFSAYIMNRLKIKNLTQEVLLGPAFDLLKGTCNTYAELEYDFKECYKALLEKLDWNNPEGADYSFDLSKPLPLIMQNDLTQVKVMKWYGYGYLEEIKVRRSDNQLYKFMEGDFPLLRVNDIEDMLILDVQNRLTNLSGDVLFDFAIALRMFIRRMVIQKRVEDLQLKRVPFTPYLDPQGFIYVDKYNKNRLMRSDELYKFSDGTLSSLRDMLKDIVSNLRMEYLPKKTWSNLEKRRARIMIKEIEKQLTERRIFRSLEKFVGGREYGNDLRLLQRTI